MTEDATLPPFDEELRALVERTRGIAAAPPASRTRVWTRVEAIVDPPPGGGGGGGPAADAAPATGAARSPSLLRSVLTIAASFALGTGVGAFAMHEHEAARLAAGAAPPALPADLPRAAPAATAPSLAGTIDEPRPSPSATLPSPPERARPTSAPSAVPVDQLTAERSLLDVARGALEREDPQTALQATTRHERRYPSGILVQEREAMAIRALLALGRVDDARSRAALFRRHFPDSVLLPTIEDALGEGGPPPRP